MTCRGRYGRDRMVVGFTTTYAISAYHHLCCEFKSHSDEVFSIQHYVIKFVSDLRQVSGFLRVTLRFRHKLTGILLKVVLSNITKLSIVILNNIKVAKVNPFSVYFKGCL